MKNRKLNTCAPVIYFLMALIVATLTVINALAAESAAGVDFQSTLTAPSSEVSDAMVSTSVFTKSKPRDWKIDGSLSIPFRGFEIQTKETNLDTSEPLGRINYQPPASLEGAIQVSYKNLGFTYRHSLLSERFINSNPSDFKNEEFRFSLFLANNLFEFSK